MPTRIIAKKVDTYIKVLHERGVHFVICKRTKAALQSGWQHKPASLDSVLKHYAKGGLLGFIPGRSGLWVLDIDKFPGENKDTGDLLASASALAVVDTPRGRHVYFAKTSSTPAGNRAWALDGYSGDIRADHGYAICWDLGKLAGAIFALADAAPTSGAAFPKPAGGPQLVEGNRNNTLNTTVFQAAQKGQTEFKREREAAISAGLDPGEVDATILSASGAAAASTFSRRDADALEGALAALGITVRYNLRGMCAEMSNGGATWAKTTDRSSADLRRLIAGKFTYRLAEKKGLAALRFGKDSWDEHLNALLFHREIDPFKTWLEALPKWDGTRRLDKLLSDCLGAERGVLTSWASVYLCLGGVQRTYEPGGLLREIPILIGPQRTGKSQLLSNLLPPDQPDWFSDSVCVSDPTQKRVEGMLGRVIVELSELTGFRRAELESLKAFISRRDDGATRLAYRRDPETALRRCILVGTSNDSECLPNDPSGNSRYVPIQCGEGSHVEPYLDKWRSHLWAEGVALYREGERANLPRELMVIQAEQGETHRRKDALIEDAVGAIIGEGPLTIKEICSSTDTDTSNIRRLADALRLSGWVKKHERGPNGSRVYLWRKQ